LLDIVRVFEGDRPAGIPACIFGLPECGDANPCPLHDQWTIIRDSFQTLLCTTMVGDLKRRTVDASREDLGARWSRKRQLKRHPPREFTTSLPPSMLYSDKDSKIVGDSTRGGRHVQTS
jgi:hypothetical protein